MVIESIKRLEFLCETITPLLLSISEKNFSEKPSSTKWSKKEILGHLLDSATNNHQRFIRVQFEDAPLISYNQDQWNKHSYYNLLEGKELIIFWATYNKHLVALLKKIPEKHFERLCAINENEKATLKFLIDDYVIHMEHHLKQIVDY
jgi:hypothetical protein